MIGHGVQQELRRIAAEFPSLPRFDEWRASVERKIRCMIIESASGRRPRTEPVVAPLRKLHDALYVFWVLQGEQIQTAFFSLRREFRASFLEPWDDLETEWESLPSEAITQRLHQSFAELQRDQAQLKSQESSASLRRAQATFPTPFEVFRITLGDTGPYGSFRWRIQEARRDSGA